MFSRIIRNCSIAIAWKFTADTQTVCVLCLLPAGLLPAVSLLTSLCIASPSETCLTLWTTPLTATSSFNNNCSSTFVLHYKHMVWINMCGFSAQSYCTGQYVCIKNEQHYVPPTSLWLILFIHLFVCLCPVSSSSSTWWCPCIYLLFNIQKILYVA